MNIVTSRTLATRRRFLAKMAAAGAFFTTTGLYAEELVKTPRQTEGPFYPDHLPLDTDNDLILINDALTPGAGEITYLSGRVLGPDGGVLRGALVEIWQCDMNGAYIHSKSGNANKRDTNFQGFGRFVTGANGEYLFRTIKPVPYTGRCPHIHVRVKQNGRDLLTTQFYIKGHPENDKDGVRRGIRDAAALASVTADFLPMTGTTTGVLAAKIDIVLGTTPADAEPHAGTPSAQPAERPSGETGSRPPMPPGGEERGQRPPPPR